MASFPNPSSFDSYVPMDRRQALAAGKTLPERSQGAVLFADVSGFTPLTIALATELGPQRGAEELTHQLNRVYNALISELYRYRGTVIGFSGDAITCWFDGDEGNQAASCALAMQKAMGEFKSVKTPTGREITMGIKIAVAVGPVRRFLVGTPRFQRIEVLAGTVLDRVAIAEQLIQQGEIILGTEVLGRLGDRALGQEWRTSPEGEYFTLIKDLKDPAAPDPWPPIPALDPEIAREWLLPPIYERLRHGQSEFLTELRHAVPLFLKFSGIDYDKDEEAGAKLDNFVRRVQEVLARYEGYLSQLTIGDKGSYLFAFFGAPLAHEDDMARAVSTATELQSLLKDFRSIEFIQIGITQGQVRAGAYGGKNRRTYGVQGTEVNLAARLMDYAQPGQVLVSPRVAKAVSGYRFKSLPATTLKGHDEPIHPYTLSGQRGTSVEVKRLSPMVGRTRERALITTRLHALLQSVNGTAQSSMIIEGEAGIGKSRLAEDLVEQAQALGIRTYIGIADAIEQTTPYYAWRPIFTKIMGLEGIDDLAQLQEIVSAYLQQNDYLLERAPLLDEVLPVNWPDNELTAQMSGEARADSTRDVLIRMLRRATEKNSANPMPPIFILEDAHWLDSASWALLSQIRRELPALLFVVVTRPMLAGSPDALVPEEYKQLVDAPDTQHLQLTTLPPDEVLDLVSQRLGASRLPGPVANLIRERAEGHPFFSEEIAYALRDSGLIRVQNGEVLIAPEAGDLSALDFPDTIQGVITSRVDRLSPAHQLTLKVASVIGRIFFFRALQSVHPFGPDETELIEQLQVLEQLDITPQETPEPEVSYIFKHIITQEVVYNLLTFAQRRQLHHAIAEWFEKVHAQDISHFYPLLAYHWSQAEVAPKAIDFLEKAGNQALRTYANEEAIRFFKQALEWDDKQGPLQVSKEISERQFRRASWYSRLGSAYYGLGSLAESNKHVRTALELLQKPMPAGTGKLALDLLSQIIRQTRHRLQPDRHIGSETQDRAREILFETARLYELLARVYFYSNETLPITYVIVRNLNLAEQGGTSPELAVAYAMMCVVAGLAQLHSLARQYASRAIKIAEQVDQPASLATVWVVNGAYKVSVGELGEVRETVQKAREICERLGDYRQWGDCMGMLGENAILEGDLATSAQISQDLLKDARRRQNPMHQIWGLRGLASVLTRQGQASEAVDLLEEALALLAENPDQASEIETMGQLALARLRLGQLEEARQAADKTVSLIADSSPTVYSLFLGYSGMAEVYLELYERAQDGTYTQTGRDELAGMARKACKHLHAYRRVFPVGHPHAWFFEGWFEQLSGKTQKAQKLWRKSLACAQEYAMPYEQGLAHFHLGRHSPDDDPARQHHLSRADQIFKRLEAPLESERVLAEMQK